MLKHPTLNLLDDLGLHGMAKGFRDLADNPESAALGHAEWLGILLDRESTSRQQKRFESRAKTARLRHLAAVEDVDYRTPRGLDRTLFLKLASCDWIREHRHCLLTGPAGVGKTDQRVPRLFAALALARGDGRYARLLKQFARVDLLILDDWGPEPLLAEQQRDLLEIVEDRLRHRLADHHQPGADRPLVRDRRQPDAGRRHPGSDHPQRTPDRTAGRKPAQAARQRMKCRPRTGRTPLESVT